MQTFIATIIILLSAAYLLRKWLPVFGVKKKGGQLVGQAGLPAGQEGSQRAACNACNACGGCG